MAYGTETLIDQPSRGYSSLGKSAYDLEGSAGPKRHFNAVEQTHQVLGAAGGLADRIQSIVSRLIGPVPENDEARGLTGSALGVFPSLRYTSDETASAIRRANEALDRLEKELA